MHRYLIALVALALIGGIVGQGIAPTYACGAGLRSKDGGKPICCD